VYPLTPQYFNRSNIPAHERAYDRDGSYNPQARVWVTEPRVYVGSNLDVDVRAAHDTSLGALSKQTKRSGGGGGDDVRQTHAMASPHYVFPANSDRRHAALHCTTDADKPAGWLANGGGGGGRGTVAVSLDPLKRTHDAATHHLLVRPQRYEGSRGVTAHAVVIAPLLHGARRRIDEKSGRVLGDDSPTLKRHQRQRAEHTAGVCEEEARRVLRAEAAYVDAS
jgi:hypothetical protein